MAFNISTDVDFVGRFTAASAEYPFGSAKNETTAGAGDGSPYILIRANDLFGMHQALLTSAGITPSGDADTALLSEYTQAIVEIASGRAITYDDSGAADVYVADLKTDQQGPQSYFPFMQIQFVAANTNTGASTIDVNGIGVIDIEFNGSALVGGEIVAGNLIQLVLNAAAAAAEIVINITVDVQDEDVLVVSNPPIINFIGGGVEATDNSGNVDVTIDGIIIQDEGIEVVDNPPVINFIGDGVSATDTAGNVDVSIPGTVASASVGADEINTGELGPVVQIQRTVKDTTDFASTITAQIPIDASIPQNSEGEEVITVTITPQNANNLLYIETSGFFGSAPGAFTAFTLALFQDSVVDALRATASAVQTNMESVGIDHYVIAGTTSPITFKLRLGPNFGVALRMLGTLTSQFYLAAGILSMSVTEYLQP